MSARRSAASGLAGCRAATRAGASVVRPGSRGISLVEVVVVLALLSVFASMALPTWQQQLAKARRAEAIAALTALQSAQEAYRAHHGSYALQLAALRVAPAVAPHYDIALVAPHGSGYIARAADGQSAHGPSEHCWNR